MPTLLLLPKNLKTLSMEEINVWSTNLLPTMQMSQVKSLGTYTGLICPCQLGSTIWFVASTVGFGGLASEVPVVISESF